MRWHDGSVGISLQNRVDPFDTIFRTAARGTMLGNRGGALHNSDREIVRGYKSRRWITYVLEFRGRRRIESLYRAVFPRRAVAFAAGHRPCAECRRQDYNAFRHAWRRVKQQDGYPLADDMDVELHPARIDRGKKALPDGCFVQIEGRPYLVWRDALLVWSPEGYERRDERPKNSILTVLTPEPIVRCFRQGYTPEIHELGRFLNSR